MKNDARDILPCSGMKIEFERSVSMELMRLGEQEIQIIKDIRQDCNNILNYDFEFEPIPKSMKIPIGINKNNCGYVRVENTAIHFYIDFENNICVIFDLIPLIF